MTHIRCDRCKLNRASHRLASRVGADWNVFHLCHTCLHIRLGTLFSLWASRIAGQADCEIRVDRIVPIPEDA